MNDPLKRISTSRWLLPFAIIFLALVLRAGYYGLEYYCQIDDYFHFREIPAGRNNILYCIEKGYFSSRPLAELMDFEFWSALNHFVAEVLVCALYAGAAVLYWNLFRRHFGTGWFFVIFFTLLPLGFEGTYWLAAATRIVPPMLFSAIALWCLDLFVETKRKWLLIPYVLFSLLSFLFYEQMLVLSLALSLMLMLLHLMKKRVHALWGLLIFLSVAAYAAFTSYFYVPDSNLGSRLSVILPWQEGYFTNLTSGLRQMGECFLDGGWTILTRGFVRGIKLILPLGADSAEKYPVLAPGILLLLPLIFVIGRKNSGDDKGVSRFWTPIFGFLAFLAPLTPFLIVVNPWFSLRNTVPSFLGIALVLDWVLRKLTKDRTAVLTTLFAAICLVASVSELHDYREVAKMNERVANVILEANEEMDFEGRVGILDLNQHYTGEQNFTYHDHILSSHCSDWALEALLRYYGAPEIDYKPAPLATDEEYYWYAWSAASKDVTAFDQLLLYDHDAGTLEPLTVQTAGELEWLLYGEGGALRGRVWQDEEGYGNIEFFE